MGVKWGCFSLVLVSLRHVEVHAHVPCLIHSAGHLSAFAIGLRASGVKDHGCLHHVLGATTELVACTEGAPHVFVG